jgi:hypothetical protein
VVRAGHSQRISSAACELRRLSRLSLIDFLLSATSSARLFHSTSPSILAANCPHHTTVLPARGPSSASRARPATAPISFLRRLVSSAPRVELSLARGGLEVDRRLCNFVDIARHQRPSFRVLCAPRRAFVSTPTCSSSTATRINRPALDFHQAATIMSSSEDDVPILNGRGGTSNLLSRSPSWFTTSCDIVSLERIPFPFPFPQDNRKMVNRICCPQSLCALSHLPPFSHHTILPPTSLSHSVPKSFHKDCLELPTSTTTPTPFLLCSTPFPNSALDLQPWSNTLRNLGIESTVSECPPATRSSLLPLPIGLRDLLPLGLIELQPGFPRAPR